MFVAIIDGTTRKQAYAKAITDKSIDFNLLNIFIDNHVIQGTLTQIDADELLGLMNPVPEIPEE
jgi:hypothetical protein